MQKRSDVCLSALPRDWFGTLRSPIFTTQRIRRRLYKATVDKGWRLDKLGNRRNRKSDPKSRKCTDSMEIFMTPARGPFDH